MPQDLPRDLELLVRVSEPVAHVLGAIVIISYPETGLFVVGGALPGLIYNQYEVRRNWQATEGSCKAMVLISQSPVMEYLDLVIGKKGRIAKFFTEHGARVEFKHRASRRDLAKAIRNPTYQHIAVVGHGDGTCWLGRDGIVTHDDLQYIMDRDSIASKPGYFLQFSCGQETKTPLGLPVVKDPSKVLGYQYLVGIEEQIRSIGKPNLGLTPFLQSD